MAKILAALAKLEDAPEVLREFYVEKDGKFLLDAEGIEDVSGLKSALGKERTARAAAETIVNGFKKAGYDDPNKVLEMSKKLEELAAFDPTKEAEKIAETKYLAREKQLIQKHQSELDASKSKGDTLFGQLKRVMVDAVATKAIADQKGAVELLLPHIQNRARLREEGSRFIVEVLDEVGNPRIGDSVGGLMTIEQLIGELKASPVFGRAFEASGASGSGAPVQGDKTRQVPGLKLVDRETMQAGGMKLEDIATGKVGLKDG